MNYFWNLIFPAQNCRVLYEPGYINNWSCIKKPYPETLLKQTLRSIFNFVLELNWVLFWAGGLEMLSVFPHNIFRDGVLTCNILPGRKPHIQGHDCHLSVQSWLNTNSLLCSLPSKTPKSSAHDFLVAGLNTNSGSLFSRPAKLWLTSTI